MSSRRKKDGQHTSGAKTAAASASSSQPAGVEEAVDELVARGLEALGEYADYTQEQIDHIVKKASLAALAEHTRLAMMAVEETGRGVFEDKAVKNIFACENITHSMKGVKTVGVIRRDDIDGIVEIAEPVGVIAGVTPVTNPTSTTIFKSLMALKTRNPIIFGFHPAAQNCSAEAARIVRDAAVKAGAPAHCVQWIERPSKEATSALMNHPGVASILATGGNAMVRAAYSCGKPAAGRRGRERTRLHREERPDTACGQRRGALQDLRLRHGVRLGTGRDPGPGDP